MFRFVSPIEMMALSFRMALAMADAQRMMAVQMLAMAGALRPVADPAPPAAEVPADTPPVQIAAERARRAGSPRRKGGAKA